MNYLLLVSFLSSVTDHMQPRFKKPTFLEERFIGIFHVMHIIALGWNLPMANFANFEALNSRNDMNSEHDHKNVKRWHTRNLLSYKDKAYSHAVTARQRCRLWSPVSCSTGSSRSFEAPWLLTEGNMLLIHFISLPSLRQPPPPQLWGVWEGRERLQEAFRCQLEGFTPLGWDRKTRNKPFCDTPATGVWLRWSFQLSQTICDSAARQSSSGGRRQSFVRDLGEITGHFFWGLFFF